jgi:hypothetical protein
VTAWIVAAEAWLWPVAPQGAALSTPGMGDGLGFKIRMLGPLLHLYLAATPRQPAPRGNRRCRATGRQAALAGHVAGDLAAVGIE